MKAVNPYKSIAIFSLLISFFLVKNIAATEAGEIVSLEIDPIISIALTPENLNLSLTPNSSGPLTKALMTVNVKTNASQGYKLTMSTTSYETALINGEFKVNSTQNEAAADLEINRWGFALGSNSETFIKIPSIGSPVTIKQTASFDEHENATDLTFGARADMSIPNGQYENELIFTAVANYLPVATDENLTLIPTYESLSYYLPAEEEADEIIVKYKESPATSWKEAYSPVYALKTDEAGSEYRGSITGLAPGTSYTINIVTKTDNTETYNGNATIETWPENPPISAIISLKDLYGGLITNQVNILNQNGTKNGYIKIDGSGTEIMIDTSDARLLSAFNSNPTNLESLVSLGLTNPITAGVANYGLLIHNSSYLILENFKIKGGTRLGVNISNSNHIIFKNSEIKNYGLNVADDPATRDEIWTLYDTVAGGPFNADWRMAPVNDSAIAITNGSSQITIEKNFIHSPNGHSNPWTDGAVNPNRHPAGPSGMAIWNSGGNNVIRYNDIIADFDNRFMDGIMSGDNGNLTGGPNRDTDIYGNLFAYGQDDGLELDGGQRNVRTFKNKTAQFFMGLSAAPNKAGPSYIYRNVITDPGDSTGILNVNNGNATKNGGGSLSPGRQYYFNNTFLVGPSNVISQASYGGSANIGYTATTRNNILINAQVTNNRKMILDATNNLASDFNNDLLASTVTCESGFYEPAFCTLSSFVSAKPGSETAGVFGLPTFLNPTLGFYYLTYGSLGKDAGIDLKNFTENFAGAAPDMGAFEYGREETYPSPYRPNLKITPDKSVLTLAQGNSGTITIYSDADQPPLTYEVEKTDRSTWLNITQSSGTLPQGGSITLDITNTSPNPRASTIFRLKFNNSYSIPLTVKNP
ncbi:hypothetical protein FACS1894191_1400 [Clostridia bacterium]|nr:hypothetical protein FACS1894191_1400 [Clostridia bacterium]